MSLEDELKLQKAEQKISDLITELNESKEKISELMTKYNEAKNKEIMLSGDVRSFQSEIKAVEAKVKNIEILNDRIEFLENDRNKSAEQISNLEHKLEIKENKIEELSQSKEKLLEEKSQILEGKNEILQKMTKKELELQQKDQTIDELKIKFKKSSTDLLSKTMEIEKLLKKSATSGDLAGEVDNLTSDLENKEKLITEKNNELEKIKQELAAVQQKIQDSSTARQEVLMGTVVVSNLESIVDQIKKILPLGKSTIRLVLPDIHDIEKFEITETIKQIPGNVVINIAANIDDAFNDMFVKDIKKYCQLTNYSERKFIAFNVDSSQFLIGIYEANEIVGIYTEFPEFIDLFKQAIMEPFIKGRKIF